MTTTPILYNLISGQYQIDDVVFGKGTTVRVEGCDIKPYDVNSQDYQASRADEIRFGQDSFKPATLELTFDVINNKMRPGYEYLYPNFWDEMPKVSDFSRIWRNDAERKISGSMKPLYVCGTDGVTRAVYGRPGQFTYSKDTDYTEVIQCLAEFRRADTLAYSALEQGVELLLSADPTLLVRQAGDGVDTWCRILLVGPLEHPVITVGDQQIDLDYTIIAGNSVEVSSYPWQRRVVDANGVNLSSNLIGKTQYLDRLVVPYGEEVPLKWTSTNANTMVPALGNSNWVQNIDGYSWLQLPPTYTQIHGSTAVKFDIFNFGVIGSPWPTTRKFIGASLFGQICACYYNAVKFNTANQFARARLVSPSLGKSVVTIMTNNDMSTLVGIMVDIAPGSHYLRIVSGGWNSLTTRGSWHNTNPLGFGETDDVAIGSLPDPDTGIVTYTAYFNGTPVITWTDTGGLIPHTVANRAQGFICDADGSLLAQGTGFCNILAYDTLEEEAQLGQVYFLWRDSWSTIG